MRYPLFAYLKLKTGKDSGSKITDLLESPYLPRAWQPYEVVEMVLERLVRDRPRHVVDLLAIQSRLIWRYGARKDIISYNMIGMVRLKMMPYGEKRLWCDSDAFSFTPSANEKKALAIRQRDRAWEKLGKAKKSELIKNRELRELFFLTNEMKGMLNAKAGFWRP